MKKERLLAFFALLCLSSRLLCVFPYPEALVTLLKHLPPEGDDPPLALLDYGPCTLVAHRVVILLRRPRRLLRREDTFRHGDYDHRHKPAGF